MQLCVDFLLWAIVSLTAYCSA